MGLLKALAAAAAALTILVAFRDVRSGSWLAPAGGARQGGGGDLDTEPVLGYDSLDRDMTVQFLQDAGLSPDELLRVRRYEQTHQHREPVLETVDRLLR